VPESKDKKAKGQQLSRIKKYQKDGITPNMPPTGVAGYLLEYLWEIGPTVAAGMGEAPISHGEIRVWQDNTGVELQTWEVQLLRRLSIEHLNQSQLASDPHCKPPYGQLYRNPNLDKAIDAALG
jgi:hypothetical protein